MGFENLDPDKFFQVVGDGVRRGHSFKLFKKIEVSFGRGEVQVCKQGL